MISLRELSKRVWRWCIKLWQCKKKSKLSSQYQVDSYRMDHDIWEIMFEFIFSKMTERRSEHC